MVNVRRAIGWAFKWLRDIDSGEGREVTKGKGAARDVMEEGRVSP